MKKLLLTTALTVLGALTALAQDGTLKGVITDSNTKETLPGVEVKNTATNKNVAITDLDGNYTAKLPAGSYQFVFSAVGKRPETRKATIKSGETTTLNVTLQDSSIVTNLVVVSEGKYEKKIEQVVSSIDILKPNIIENKATTSVDQAVQQAPGVIIVNSEPQIRGGSGYSFGAGSRVMILIDDLPILSGDAGRPSWGFFPMENIEQIEVSKGASSVLYGSAALNGVINIRTAYPREKPETKLSIFQGVYDFPRNRQVQFTNGNDLFFLTNMNFLHSRRIKNLDLVIGGNLYKDTGFKGRELADTTQVYVSVIGGAVEKPKIKIEDENGNVIGLRDPRQDFEQRARFNFNLRYNNQKLFGLNYGVNGIIQYSESAGSLLWLNNSDGLYNAFPGSNTLTLQTTASIDPFLNYTNDNGSSHRLRTRYYHQNNNNDNNQANLFNLGFAEYQYSKRFSLADSNDTRFVDHLVRFIGEKAVITGGVMNTYTVGEASLYEGNESGDGRSTALNSAAYIQYENRYRDRLTYVIGGRYEYFNINNVQEAKPVFRAGFNYKFAKRGIFRETYLRASYGQGFRFPTIAEKFIRTNIGAISIYPNTDLGSETAWNAEVALKQGIKIGNLVGYLDVAYFLQRFENTIEFTFGSWGNSGVALNDLGFRAFNIGRTQVSGVDVSLLTTGKIGNVTINTLLGYTYMNPIHLGIDDPIPGFITSPIFPDLGPSYRSTLSDPNSNFLKYRFRHLAKVDIELIYKKWMIGGSMRYNSFMVNIDEIFNRLDPLLNYGIKTFRDARNQKGDYIIDFRIGYDVSKTSRVSLAINNLLNREYSLRPGEIMPPRVYNLQWNFKF